MQSLSGAMNANRHWDRSIMYSLFDRSYLFTEELMNVQSKREREKQLVSQMIALYCRKKHGGKGLCPDCAALNTYARQRSDRCPFMETKTFCSNCKVHCYKPEMRSQIRAVMRFSGPRMVFHHPVIAVRHVIESSKEKRRLEKTT